MSFYSQLIHSYTFSNTNLLIISIITFAFGFWEYIYSFRIALRQKRSPFPIWMHTFYIAHDSTFAVLFLIAASKFHWYWFLLGVSIALFVWNMFEIACIYLTIRDERQEIFGKYTNGPVTKTRALLYFLAQIAAMYTIVWMVIMYIGNGCLFQWTVLTNMVMAGGPTIMWLRQKDRSCMSIGMALVILAGTINTFLPQSMFVQVFPQVFNHPVYYITGVVFSLIALFNVFIAISKKPLSKTPTGKKPIW